VFFAVWPATASADWEVRKVTDQMSDVQTVFAAVRKRGCCAIHVAFNDIGVTFSPLIRFDSAKGPLLPKIELRVDKQRPWSLVGEVHSDRTLLLEKNKDLDKLIKQMAAGSILKIRYWTKTSGSSIVQLPLRNAYRSLQQAEQWALKRSADTVKRLADVGIPYEPLFPVGQSSRTTNNPQPVAVEQAAKPAKASKRFDTLMQRARSGDTDAQYGLAMWYGPPVNRISAKEAFALLEQASGAGNLHAMAELGFRQFFGKGTKFDNALGLATLEEAGKLGHPNGYFILGGLYGGQAREHIAPDHAKAVRYYEDCIALQGGTAIDEKTANFYIRQCLTNLGRHNLLARGTRKDLYRARALFQQAADMGEPIGMYYLAFTMLNGEGGSKNREGAIAWLQKSKAAGNKSAAKALAELKVPDTVASAAKKPVDPKDSFAARQMRPKYVMYAFMLKANKRDRLKKFKPTDVNIRSKTLAGNPESEIFYGMLLQNTDFLERQFIGAGTPYQFSNRGEMRDAMLDTYDKNDPYKPMKFTGTGHKIMDALASHMKLDSTVDAIARRALGRRNQ